MHLKMATLAADYLNYLSLCISVSNEGDNVHVLMLSNQATKYI